MARSFRLRDAALTAAKCGLHVFRCVPRGKPPATHDRGTSRPATATRLESGAPEILPTSAHPSAGPDML